MKETKQRQQKGKVMLQSFKQLSSKQKREKGNLNRTKENRYPLERALVHYLMAFLPFDARSCTILTYDIIQVLIIT